MRNDVTFTIHHAAYQLFVLLTIGAFACFGILRAIFEKAVLWDSFTVVWEVLFLILLTALTAKTPKGLDEYVCKRIPIVKKRFFRFIPFLLYGVVFGTFLSVELIT